MPAGGVQCPAGEAQGFYWNVTDAGVTASQSCDVGFSGTVTRACSDEGVWGEIVNSCSTYF